MIRNIKKLTLFGVLKDSIRAFGRSDSMTYSASIAFYTIFSLPALLIILLNIGAAFFSESTIQEELTAQVSRLAGEESANMLKQIIQRATTETSGVISQAIAIGILVFSATTVFVSLQNSINHIWHIRPKPEKGLLKFVVNRLLSFSLVASIGFIMLVSLVIDTLLVVFFDYLTAFFEGYTFFLASITNLVFTQSLMVVIFGLMYKILPDAKVMWRSVWLGAIMTMVLFAIGKYLIGIYLGNSNVGSAYGAAGSLVIFLVWVYYSSSIFLFGAQITYFIAENTGKGISPIKEAVKIEVREIEKSKN